MTELNRKHLEPLIPLSRNTIPTIFTDKSRNFLYHSTTNGRQEFPPTNEGYAAMQTVKRADLESQKIIKKPIR